MLIRLKNLLKSYEIDITRIHVFKAGHPDIFAFAKNTPAKRPKSMLNRFSKLVGTLNSKIPATERGILFSDPTKLYVVGPVCCKNHIDVKLMARPRNPLDVETIQNIGDLIIGVV